MNTELFSQFSKEYQAQFAELFVRQCKRKTHGESTSVSEETAHSILSSIIYTINYYIKNSPNYPTLLDALEESSLLTVFQNSLSFIENQLFQCKYIMKLIHSQTVVPKSYAYRNTTQHALPEFLLYYDIEFEAHETTTKSMIDYQLAVDYMDTSGIEYIIMYMKKLHFENDLCEKIANQNLSPNIYVFFEEDEDAMYSVMEMVLRQIIKEQVTCIDQATAFYEEMISSFQITNRFERQYLKEVIDQVAYRLFPS